MKVLFVVFAFCLVFIGCKEEEQSAALLGIWEGQSRLVSDCDDDPDAISTTRLNCNQSSCFLLELRSDGTYSYLQGNLTENGTYTGDFSSLTLCMSDEGEEMCTSFVVEGNTSVTLDISTTNAGTGCKTTLQFNRRLEEDPN